MAKTASTASSSATAGNGKSAALRVVSKSPMGTFRRAGFTFGRIPVVVPLSLLTAEQVEAIRTTPMLDVTDVDADPPGTPGTVTPAET
jgi:hypothetical protein